MKITKFRLEVFVLFPIFFASVLALILYPLRTYAGIYRIPSTLTPCWSANLINSAFGKYSSSDRPGYEPPVYYYADCPSGGADIWDKQTLSPYSFEGTGSSRNLNTYRNYIPIPTTTGINYSTFNGIAADSYGFEDTTLQYAVCDGTYPDDSSIYTHNCLQGVASYNQFGLTAETQGDSVVPYPPAIKTGFPDNLGPDAWRAAYTSGMFKNGAAHSSVTTSHPQEGFDSDLLNLHFKRIAIASCSPRNICTDETHVASRQANCNYLPEVTCNGVCINGTCDPATVPAANVTTAPISPVTNNNPLDKITITTPGGLLQCKYKRDYGSVLLNNTIGYGESYYVDNNSYSIDATVPTTAKYIMAWIAPDQSFSILPNQRPVYLNGRYDLSTNGPNGYFGNFNTATRVFHLDLFPTVGWHSPTELWPGNRTYFLDEASSKKAQFGAYGRGDSFVLQLQANNAASDQKPWSRTIQDTQYAPYAEPPVPITLPEYYHYTMPSYQQCAPPAEVTPTVASSTVLCSNPVNKISWSAVPGADQYMVLIRRTTGDLSIYDGQSIAWGDFMATTTATFYNYTVPTPMSNYPPFQVKVYAHNANGWNISNNKVSFTGTSPSSCPGSIKISRYGSDGMWAPNTVPAGTQGRVDSLVATSTNASDFTDLSLGDHTAYATDVAGYTETMGTCTYAIGGTECPVTTFSTPTCNGGFCSIPTTVYGSQVTKVGVKYTTSNIQIVGYAADGVTPFSPAQQGRVDTLTAKTLPAQFTTLSPSSHTVEATDISDYTETVGTCTYPIGGNECDVTTFNLTPSCNGTYCSTTVTTAPGQWTKVGIKYDVYTAPLTGTVQVYRYGWDGSSTTALPPDTQIQVDSLSPTSTNPIVVTNVLTSASVPVQSTNVSGYGNTFGICTYPIGGTECSFSSSTFNNTPYCTSAWCTRYIPVTAGTVTKVGVLYANSGIQVARYGSNLAWPSTAPAGTEGKVDELTASSANPVDFMDLSVGAHTAYATDVAGYTETMGTCTYEIGTAECTIPGYTSSGVTCNGTLCSKSVTTFAGYLTKVGVKYTSSSIQIVRYGTDGVSTSTPSTAGTQSNIDSTSLVATNPSYFADQTIGSHTVYSTDQASTTETMGTCTYAIGAAECTVKTFSTPTCNGTLCSKSVTTTAGRVTKVGIKYKLLSANIRISRYGSNGAWSPNTVPDGTQGQVDPLTASSTNPSDFFNLTVSDAPDINASLSHSVSSTAVSGYSITYGYCNYPITGTECDIPLSSSQSETVCNLGFCGTSVNGIPGQVTKVALIYTSTTGSIRVSHYGSDLSVWPSPNLPSGTQSKIESTALVATNPIDYTGLTQGTHTVSVTDISNYTETIGMCTYPEGGTECTLASSDFAINPTCDGTLCSTPALVTSGNMTKVGVMYTSTISPPTTPSTPTATSACNAGYTAADVTVSWSPSSGAVGYKVYRSSIQGGAGTLIGSPASSSYVDSGLDYGQTYYYSVSASNSGGDSAQTSQVQVITQSYCTGTCTNGAPNPYPLPDGNNYPTCSCSPFAPLDIDTGMCTSTSTIAVVSNFVAKPNIVNKGSTFNIQVNVSDSSGCTISGTNGDLFNIDIPSGSINTSVTSSPIQETTKFTLTCLGVGKDPYGNDLITNKETLGSVNAIIKER